MENEGVIISKKGFKKSYYFKTYLFYIITLKVMKIYPVTEETLLPNLMVSMAKQTYN